MKLLYPDYNNSLVNVSNSILKYYGVENHHSTLSELDKYLENDYKNVVLVLQDAFGSNLLEKDSFLYKNKIKDITSVFPATTTAATTSIITGLTPMEHCWLGWDNYVASLDKVITMYWNVDKATGKKVADYSVCMKEFPYKTIFDKINEVGNAKAYCVSPFDGVHYESNNIDEMYKILTELCNNDEKKFIYAYCVEPDHLMHELGVKDEKITILKNELDIKAAEFCNNIDDTLIIFISDHGHITVDEYIVLDDYPKIKDMLIRETSLESRATNFFVKEGMLESFKDMFNKLFYNDFLLLSKEEVLTKKLFGDGIANEKFESCLGDFIALAITSKAIIDKNDDNPLKGLHAGVTEDEMLVPLTVIDKKTCR